jgi:universal stress protein A
MPDYRRILAVVDLTGDSDQVIDRARTLASRHGARLQLLHVVEYVPVEPMGDALLPAVQIEEDLVHRARERLSQMATDLGVASEDWFVEAGNIKAEIVRVAQEQTADLIVLGSRERHGLAILLNFTEDTVLHAAPCDVLAVRLRK